MLKANELTDPESCLARAFDDEPLFVLRANDECAPMSVREWAEHYRFYKESVDAFDERARAKYQGARKLSFEMEAWRAVNVKP